MGEFSKTDISEIKTNAVENYKSIKPEKELSVKELNDAVSAEFNKTAKDAGNGLETKENDNAEGHKDCLTTSDERKKFAESSDGKWDGEPGDSSFHPEKQEAKDALERYKQDGIDYVDGEPDFSKVSETTVKIDDMTSNRPYNFKQASEACAKHWNDIGKDGRNDWTGSKVEAWRTENRYSWHERLDMKTMDLVQRDIHEECKHFGGVSECRRHEALNGGGFDE